MAIGTVEEIIDDDLAIIWTSSGREFYVAIMSFVDKDRLEPSCSVMLHHKTQAIVGVLQDDTDPMVSAMKLDKAPMESYADVGGLDQQIQELKEAVELPLTHPELYEEMGIRQPKGVIVNGMPGMRKILLAKAVANQPSATFLRVSARCWFRTHSKVPRRRAEVGAGAVLRGRGACIEHHFHRRETDAIGTKRYESTSGGDLDGFDTRGDVKIFMATNRAESLDPALICPGRIDRKIEFPLPNVKAKRHIFQLHTSRMSLSEDARPWVHHAISLLHPTSPGLKQPPFLRIFKTVVLRYF
ncbi:26S protease regulatory subunit [Phellopilus nigrolimitatus]|nr:26S protease regulatory subunit [Phellopilus nigrolimitatus]